MAINTAFAGGGSELVIAVEGRFDFSVHQEFRRAYEEAEPVPERYVVDMKGATYLDSSALGMLLLLRDHAGGDSADVAIINSNDEVRKILTVSNFDQLFTIQ